MNVTEIISSISAVVKAHPDNFIRPASSSHEIIEFLESRHKKLPPELRDYLAAVDGGCLTFPLFFEYERDDFIGSVGTGDLLSHRDIKEILTRTFSKDSIYHRTDGMADNYARQKTIPIVSIGDGQTIDYRPSNGKVYCFGRVVAQSLADFLIKQCLMPDFFRPEESRCHEGSYALEWVDQNTPPATSLQAFKDGLGDRDMLA